MPLMGGKSKKAFPHNVETEMNAGKPQKQSLAIAYSMARKKKKASGGTVESGDSTMNMAHGGEAGYQSSCHEHCNHPGQTHEEASGYEQETHPTSEPTEQGLTESGQQGPAHDMDMVGRAMHKRHMSRGGQVSNTDLPVADFDPNEFDYLHTSLSEGADADYTGSNSGDQIGNEGEDKRRREANDLVSRAMRRRKR